RRHTSFSRDWSSDVCSSDLAGQEVARRFAQQAGGRRKRKIELADAAHAVNEPGVGEALASGQPGTGNVVLPGQKGGGAHAASVRARSSACSWARTCSTGRLESTIRMRPGCAAARAW